MSTHKFTRAVSSSALSGKIVCLDDCHLFGLDELRRLDENGLNPGYDENLS